MSFQFYFHSSVFDNPDLLREIGRFVEPRLPMHFVFHTAREAFLPLEQKQTNVPLQVYSHRRNFVSSIKLLKWALEMKCTFDPRSSLCDYAAAGGSVDVLDWVYSNQYKPNSYPCKSSALYEAVKNDQLEAARYIRTNFLDCDWLDLYVEQGICCNCAAAENGNIEMLEFLISDESPGLFCENCCDSAVFGGSIEAVNWLLPHKGDVFKLNEKTFQAAAAAGRIDMLNWLKCRNPPVPWDENVCNLAVDAGQLHVLKWLLTQVPPCPIDEAYCKEIAVSNGNLDILKYFYSLNPYETWDAEVSGFAAFFGHLDILKWFKSLTPPAAWDGRVLTNAIEGNNIEVIKYALTHSSPLRWNELCTMECVELDRVEIIQWLVEQEILSKNDVMVFVDNEKRYKSRMILLWLNDDEK